MLKGERPVIFGDGNQTRDFTFISNVVEANLSAAHAEGAAGQTMNIGCGNDMATGTFWGGLIDLDPSESPESSAAQLMQVMESPGAEDQMIVRKGLRHYARLQRVEMDLNDGQNFEIHEDGSYLITGGLGGIGFETARWLGQKGARRLLIVGRTSLPDRESWEQTDMDISLRRRIERIQGLENAGVQVTYVAGCTDIMIKQDRWRAARSLVNLNTVDELKQTLRIEEKGVLIGASLPMTDLIQHPVIQDKQILKMRVRCQTR